MEACVNQVVVGGGSRKGQYWINSPAIAASATDAAIVSCPSPPLPRELFSTAAPNSCCMPEGDLGSSLVRQSGVCSRSTATTWLTRPQWQGSFLGLSSQPKVWGQYRGTSWGLGGKSLSCEMTKKRSIGGGMICNLISLLLFASIADCLRCMPCKILTTPLYRQKDKQVLNMASKILTTANQTKGWTKNLYQVSCLFIDHC